jgi:hypothetical protein
LAAVELLKAMKDRAFLAFASLPKDLQLIVLDNEWSWVTCLAPQSLVPRAIAPDVAARADRGELDGVEIEDGKLYIARTKPVVSGPSPERLRAAR